MSQKRKQQHFLFFCKELEQRNAKRKEDRYYSEIEMLLIHKRAVSLLKGERGEGGGCIYFHYSQGNIQQQRLISLVHSYRNFFNHKEALLTLIYNYHNHHHVTATMYS